MGGGGTDAFVVLSGAKPTHHIRRRLQLETREEAENIIKEVIPECVMESSRNPWAFYVLLVKKGRTSRFCVYYQLLNNNATKKDNYPLPRNDDTLHT